MSAVRQIVFFLLASLALCVATFGDSVWGKSIAAPVDHAPALWKEFSHVDPDSNGIPANHHIVDQLSYDLPLQWTIYQEWRGGRIPWWSPFTYGGRPLLADAHCNGADWIRILVYSIVPDFVLAYNWVLILHHVWLAIGVFFLLKSLKFRSLIAAGAALTTQFAGSFVLYIGHPWITASFAWYPWLWCIWMRWEERPEKWHPMAASICVAAIFFAGNIQSHAYLPAFAFAFILGYGGRNFKTAAKCAGRVAASGILGGLMAAPILGPGLELFGVNERSGSTYTRHWIDGFLSFSAAWPWSLGTFRTLGYQSLGFHLFVGSAGFILALLGVRADLRNEPELRRARSCSIFLLSLYLVILSSPLASFFYARSAGLGVMGLCVLIALGCRRVITASPTFEGRLWAKWLCFYIAILIVGTVVAVHVLYPRLRPRMQAMMDSRQATDGYSGRSKPLRDFQVSNYPAEVGFRNPEVLFGILSLCVLALALRFQWKRPQMITVVLVMNLVSPLLFAARFIPRNPRTQWDRLLLGSAKQRAVAETLRENSRRLHEEPGSFDQLFPMELAHLARVHVLQGYAALQPPSQLMYPAPDPGKVADVFHRLGGGIDIPDPTHSARIHRIIPEESPVSIRFVSLGELEISFTSSEVPSRLLRTDTHYPGWRATSESGVPLDVKRVGIFSIIDVPAGTTRVSMRYSPSGLKIYCLTAAIGFLGAFFGSRIKRRQT